VSKGRNKELFLITIVVLCFAAAWGTAALGLSLALGAFFAGLIISETDQAYQATGIVQPFHELFMSFFFVSIGMLVDPALFANAPFTVLGLALVVVVVKIVATFFSVWLLRQPVRTALLTGLALFQVGEFSFVLAMSGIAMGLLSREHHQLFLAVSILTMGATPFALQFADDIVRRVFTVFLPRGVAGRLDSLMRVRREEERTERKVLRDHVVIVGFGLNGQNVARSAQSSRIRCAVIEEDPDLAEKAMSMGLHVVLGDATNDHVLEKVHVEQARVVVVAIADAEATRRIVSRVRSHTAAHLIVRTRFVREIEAILGLGANEVIPEEFETSIAIFHRVLRRYLVTEPQIQEITAHFRSAHYGLLRGNTPKAPVSRSGPPVIPGLEIATVPVTIGRTRIVGHTLEEIDLRGRFGITVLAILRAGRTITHIEGNERIRPDDVLYILGGPDNIVRLNHELH
jgi:CPA2 family monovalent cation:H+ antiporter-2